jgi:glucokinase
VISGGKPLYGASGVAGNLGGHVLAELDGPQCVCGLRGCVEACVGTWALPAIARASVLFPTSALAHEAVIDYRTVFRLAKAGDQLASELRDKALKYWALLLINLTQAYDPQAIILGGGIMAGKADILPALTGLLQNQLHKMQHKPNLLAASLGDDAALAGLDFLCRNPSL